MFIDYLISTAGYLAMIISNGLQSHQIREDLHVFY